MILLKALLVFAIGEIVTNFLFHFVRKYLGPEKEIPSSGAATNSKTITIGKGIFERLVLLTFIFFNYSQIVIVFGTLKIGTRLKTDSDNKISNDYFLVGNLLSVLMAFIYYLILRNWIVG